MVRKEREVHSRREEKGSKMMERGAASPKAQEDLSAGKCLRAPGLTVRLVHLLVAQHAYCHWAWSSCWSGDNTTPARASLPMPGARQSVTAFKYLA